MISGIRSLSATHEQFLIGWIGDIESNNTNSGTSPRVAKPMPRHFMTSFASSFAPLSRAYFTHT
jgi:hypothetical protein